MIPRIAQANDSCHEQRHRRLRLQSVTYDAYGYRHELSVGRDVEDLFTIAIPDGFRTPVYRNRNLPISRRKRCRKDFNAPCFSGAINHPPPVRSKPSLPFVEITSLKSNRFSLAEEWHYIRIAATPLGAGFHIVERDIAPIGGPVHHVLGRIALKQ